jgi:hypothetical protein
MNQTRNAVLNFVATEPAGIGAPRSKWAPIGLQAEALSHCSHRSRRPSFIPSIRAADVAMPMPAAIAFDGPLPSDACQAKPARR